MPDQKGAISSYSGPSLADKPGQSGGLFSCCFGPTIVRLEIPPPPHKGKPFLPAMKSALKGRKTLALDLDETLVHSSFTPIENPDYVIPVEMEGEVMEVYVLKRPYCDEFLEAVSKKFEVGVFTASLKKYAAPLLDKIDRKKTMIHWRLYREACYPRDGKDVKDITCLGRDHRSCIAVDNAPFSYPFQPYNCIPIKSFIDDKANDVSLKELLPTILQLAEAEDVRPVIRALYYPDTEPVYLAEDNMI